MPQFPRSPGTNQVISKRPLSSSVVIWHLLLHLFLPLCALITQQTPLHKIVICTCESQIILAQPAGGFTAHSVEKILCLEQPHGHGPDLTSRAKESWWVNVIWNRRRGTELFSSQGLSSVNSKKEWERRQGVDSKAQPFKALPLYQRHSTHCLGDALLWSSGKVMELAINQCSLHCSGPARPWQRCLTSNSVPLATGQIQLSSV